MDTILKQQHEDLWLPVTYVSRAITETQRKYAPIEREALAIQFSCDCFHLYIYGRPVQLETNRKPLVVVFKKALNACPARLQRIRFKEKKIDLHFSYTTEKSMHAANALSCAVMADDIRNIDQTELDVEAQVAAVIKYMLIADKKWMK